MNILHLCTHLNFGGIASYIVSLAKALKEKSHEVYVGSSGGSLQRELSNFQIEHLKLNIRTKSELNPKLIPSFFKLVSFIKEREIQIIHAHTRVTQVLGNLLSKFTRVTYVSTCHGFFKRRISRRIFPCWGKKVIAISEAVREHLIEDLKVNPEHISMIPNGIDLEKFKPSSPESKLAFKKRMGLACGTVVGIIARLSEIKGHKFLIMSLKEILKKKPSVQLLIVGEGRLKSELVDLVDKLCLKKNVFFIPPLRKNTSFLSAMDIFAMPSLQEGLGFSIMEALAMELPVVASSVGGISSLVRNYQTGILVKPRDVEGLSTEISRLIEDEKLAKKLGKNGRHLIEEKFSLKKMVEAIEALYNEVLR